MMVRVTEALNDTHTTDGEHYRIPAHPRMIAALGRVVWNFLSLEEAVAIVLTQAGELTLDQARALGGARKATALTGKALPALQAKSAPADLVELLEHATSTFQRLCDDYRNGILHGGMFTAGFDDDGTYLPGISFTTKAGDRQGLDDAASVHAIAHEIEECSGEFGQVRERLNAFLGG